MPILSEYAQKKKIQFFISDIEKDAKVLEIGSGSGWLSKYMHENGWLNYTGIDIVNTNADIVGDIKNWNSLGLKKGSFDYIIAFEVAEHIDIFNECYDLLKKGGKLLLTTPVPHMDWILYSMEKIGLNQKRTSPHSNLVYIKNISNFKTIKYQQVALLAQWGKYKKE